MGDELRSQWWIFDMFILVLSYLSIENSILSKVLVLKFGLNSEFFDKIPVTILLDVPFRVFRFTSLFIKF